MEKPVIYVNLITNLSDARYCAGMGVDMLGFVVNPDHVDYVSPSSYREMIGWISGPKRVAEITSMVNINLEEVVSNYKPDLLHISSTFIGQHNFQKLSLMVEVAFENWLSFQAIPLVIDYLLITHLPAAAPQHLNSQKGDCPVILSLDKEAEAVIEMLQQYGADGFALQGSRELAPGLKDYDHLSRILEELVS